MKTVEISDETYVQAKPGTALPNCILECIEMALTDDCTIVLRQNDRTFWISPKILTQHIMDNPESKA